jgi:hypothetical protein
LKHSTVLWASLGPESVVQKVYKENLDAGLVQTVLPIQRHELSAHPMQLGKRERGRRKLNIRLDAGNRDASAALTLMILLPREYLAYNLCGALV